LHSKIIRMIPKLRAKIYTISNRLGQKIGIDLPYYIENGFWVTMGQVFAMFAGLLLSVAFARLTTQEVYGQYQLVLSIVSIISIVSIPGLNTSIVQSVANGFDGSYKQTVGISFRWSLVGVPLLGCVGGYYYFFEHEFGLAITFLVGSVFFPFLFAPNTWGAFLQGKSKFELFSIWTSIENIATTIILIACIWFFPDHLLVISMAYFIAKAFFNLWFYKSSLRFIKTNDKDDDTIKYGWYLTKLQILALIVTNLDMIIIGTISYEKLAIYAIALKLLDIIKNFSKSIFSITFPKFAQKDVNLSYKNVLLIFSIGFFAALFFYLIIDFIIVFLYTDKFIASTIVFKKIIWSVVLYTPYFFLVQKVVATKDKNKLIKLTVYPPLAALLLPIGIFLLTQNIELLVIARVYINILVAFYFVVKK